MKSRTLIFMTVMIVFAALAIPIGLVAQNDVQPNKTKHHHYKFIDLGTFGGPTSRNDAIYPALNNSGTVIGMADTNAPDPSYPNYNPLILPGGASDPYIFRAFASNNGQLVALDSLPGGYSAYPSGISRSGLIAGMAINGALDPITGFPEETAVFWQQGKITNLGTLGGYESGSSMVNSRGQVAGFATNAIPDPYSFFNLGTQARAFLWDETYGMQDIGTLGGPDAVSTSINDRGQIAGASYTNSVPTVDPFLWEEGTMIDLGSLGGTSGFEGDGVALNNHGQIVGSSNLAGDIYYHPFLWTKPGPMQDLGTFGGNYGTANAVNEAGEVVGWATNSGDQALFAFFWKNGTLTNLGVLPGKVCSYAHQINAEGQVTGSSDDDCADGNSHAFLWENGGPMVDLNDLVSGADMTLGGATGINDRGEITGVGTLANGDLHAFLMIPCDENHPGVEGCDYSLLDATPQTNPAPVSQLTSTEVLATPAPVSLGFLNRLRARRLPGFHTLGPGAGPANHSMTFNYTGAQQNFTVPTGVTHVTVKAYGGGSGSGPGGGYVQATIPVTSGESLAILVGGNPNGATGGFNGGGNGGGSLGFGGGGASDVRQGGNALANRVIVAGGGGDAGTSISSCQGGAGGAGGGLVGGNGTAGGCSGGSGGGGGGQSAGGSGGGGASVGCPHGFGRGKNGTLGIGGAGGPGCGEAGYSPGGGGGGGYYGGGGGGGGANTVFPVRVQSAGGGGGGGSSYTEPSAGNIINQQGGSTRGVIIISW